jgi:hypothetical protein
MINALSSSLRTKVIVSKVKHSKFFHAESLLSNSVNKFNSLDSCVTLCGIEGVAFGVFSN